MRIFRIGMAAWSYRAYAPKGNIMKNYLKRICAFVLAAILVLSAISVAGYAAEDSDVNEVYTVTIKGVAGVGGGDLAYGTDLSVVIPSNPKKSGYRFTGWVVTKTTGEVIEQPATMPDYDIIFTAQWEPNAVTYTLTFLNDDGDVIATGNYPVGAEVKAPSYTPPVGMRLTGWRNAETGRIETVPAVMPERDLEYLAVIEEIYYTITFMDGTKEVGEVTVNYGEKGEIIDGQPKANKVFVGWSTGEDALSVDYYAGDVIDLNEDMTLYGIWRDSEHTVTFMDGTTELGEVTVNDGEKAVLIDAPAKSGYTFLGWSADAAAAEATYAAGDEVELTEDLVLYAVWKKNQPVITLKYPALSFEDEIVLNVFFDTTDLEGVTLEDMGMITFSGSVEDGNIHNAEAVIPGTTLNGGFYCARTEGIAAKKLGDAVYFRIYAKLADGSYIYSPMASYSPKKYAYSVLNGNYGDDMKALVVAMLNYGSEAQNYFSYNTDALVNADLTAEQKALVEAYRADMVNPVVKADSAKTGNFVNNGGFSRRYPAVSFEGAFCINYFFTPANPVDGNLVLYYWNQAAYNSADVLTTDNATGALLMMGDSERQADVTGIAAKDLDGTVYVAAVYTSGGTTYCSGVLAYSIGAYCTDRIANGSATMQTFAAATAVYGYYAKSYFFK